MRTLTFLLAALTSAPAALAHGGGHHHHRHERPAEACAPGELRVSTPDDAWYDLHLDGREVASSRGFSTQERITLSPGRHHLQVTSFMGDSWSRSGVTVGCGEVIVAEVRDERGLRILTRFGAKQPERQAHRRPHRHEHRSHGRHHARPEACSVGQLVVEPGDDTWYDVYLDGEKVLENRNFDGTQVLTDLTPGRHYVRVTDFMGEVIDEQVIRVGCSSRLYATVSERGLRLI